MENLHFLKENFIKKICKERGWNVNKLTNKQFLFIMLEFKKINLK